MNRSSILKIAHRLNSIFKYLNKYFYLLPLLSLLSSIKNNKYFNTINYIIKIILYINIFIGVGTVIYFIDFTYPINNTFSIYYDFLKPYIDFLNNLWNDLITLYNNLINISVEESIASKVKDSLEIKNEIKSGIKEGVKEALDEILDEIQNDIENRAKSSTDLLKQSALIASVLFFGYFLLYLPINPVDLTQYNWINQSLIEFKITIKDLIINLISNIRDTDILFNYRFKPFFLSKFS